MTIEGEFVGMSWDEVREDATRELWLVPGMVANTSTLLYGEAEAGKSFLCSALVASLTSGEPFLGAQPNGGPYRVAVGWTDDGGAAEYRQRIASATGTEDDPGVWFFHLPVMRREDQWDGLLAGLRARDCDVLVLDNMSQAADGDLDKNAPAREFFAGVRRIVSAGIPVIVVAHSSGKSYGNGKSDQPLGHSTIVGAVRWRAFVKRQPDDRIKITFQGNHARKHDLTVEQGEGARFAVVDTNTAEERQAKEAEREAESLDEYRHISRWVVEHCQGQGVNATVRKLHEKFGRSERTYKTQLSTGKLSTLLVRHGTAEGTTWRLSGEQMDGLRGSTGGGPLPADLQSDACPADPWADHDGVTESADDDHPEPSIEDCSPWVREMFADA